MLGLISTSRGTKRVWALESERPGITVHFGTGGANDSALEATAVVESTYYLAFRFKGLIEAIGRSVEGNTACKNFDPPGVRSVRNDLLEHNKVATWTFATGAGLPNGPRLKPIGRGAPHDPEDPGLYANIDEFLDHFVRRVATACTQYESKGGTR